MGKYTSDAKELLHLVGGRENIAAVSHCITRMRFVLNDPKKADIQKIEAMKVVKGSFTQAGQFQVIIGNTVSDFYNDFIAVAGIEGVSKDAVKSAAKQNQNVVQRIMTALAEIFAPLIPAIIVGGLILGFRNCTCKQIYIYSAVFKKPAEGFVMLAGEDFSGRHKSALPAVFDGTVTHSRRNCGFARAYIALNEPAHCVFAVCHIVYAVVDCIELSLS